MTAWLCSFIGHLWCVDYAHRQQHCARCPAYEDLS